MLMSLFRIWLSGGAIILTVVVFLSTGSLWSLALMLPWLLALKIMRGLDR
jgi:hypothetical protein